MSKSKKEVWIKSLFFCYLPILVWIILFRVSLSSSDFHNWRELNFIPFYYEFTRGDAVTIIISLMNVVVFMPMGIYSGMLGQTLKRAVVTGLAVTVILETCQYVFTMGVCDITDALTNLLGTVCGVFLYEAFTKRLGNKEKSDFVILVLATGVTALFLIFLVYRICS